jgi:hypothetical protein
MRKSPGESFRVEATAECTRCGQPAAGWIAFGSLDPNDAAAGPTVIVDSGGFMVFADGIVCDGCIGGSSGGSG